MYDNGSSAAKWILCNAKRIDYTDNNNNGHIKVVILRRKCTFLGLDILAEGHAGRDGGPTGFA